MSRQIAPASTTAATAPAAQSVPLALTAYRVTGGRRETAVFAIGGDGMLTQQVAGGPPRVVGAGGTLAGLVMAARVRGWEPES